MKLTKVANRMPYDEMENGQLTFELYNKGLRYTEMMAYRPNGLVGAPRALVVLLHGGRCKDMAMFGEPGDESRIVRAIDVLSSKYGPIVALAPNWSYATEIEEADADIFGIRESMLRLLKHAQALFGEVPRERRVLAGFGRGAAACWRMAYTAPEAFSTLVPVDSCPWGVGKDEKGITPHDIAHSILSAVTQSGEHLDMICGCGQNLMMMNAMKAQIRAVLDVSPEDAPLSIEMVEVEGVDHQQVAIGSVLCYVLEHMLKDGPAEGC